MDEIEKELENLEIWKVLESYYLKYCSSGDQGWTSQTLNAAKNTVRALVYDAKEQARQEERKRINEIIEMSVIETANEYGSGSAKEECRSLIKELQKKYAK